MKGKDGGPTDRGEGKRVTARGGAGLEEESGPKPERGSLKNKRERGDSPGLDPTKADTE